MRSRPVSYVKAHLAEVIASVREGSEPVMVTQNGANAVVIEDLEAYERTRATLLMLKLVALGEREIARTGGISHQKLFSTVRARLKRRGHRAA
jgi:prevent-host-death family protein